MAAHSNKKNKLHTAAPRSPRITNLRPRKHGRRKLSAHQTAAAAVPAKTQEAELVPDLDMEWLRDGSREEERAEVEALTNRMFSSVLERCGWRRDETGRFEHVGHRS
ncbi:MAG TPA: hypothetical protein VG892_14735 [Terriglobales bacterium]|jgi:hypothetical protein|nr:hypothetical protein [Terriglobales bacterium]